jgi:tape measure domain-containing protein
MTTAKTISSVNVALGLDYSKFKGGVAQSKSEFYTLQKILQESTPDIDRYNYALTLLAKAEKEHVMTAQQAERAFESLQKTYKRGAYAVTELTLAHEQYIADLKRATAIADRHDNERRMANYRAEMEEVQRLVRIGKLTERAAQSHLDAYKRTLPGYTDWAAKRDKIIASRQADSTMHAEAVATERLNRKRQAMLMVREAELSLLTSGQQHLRNLAEITLAAERAGTSQERLAAIIGGLQDAYDKPGREMQAAQQQAQQQAHAEAVLTQRLDRKRQALTTLRDAELSLLTPGQRHLRNLAEITLAAERAGTSQARLAAIIRGLQDAYDKPGREMQAAQQQAQQQAHAEAVLTQRLDRKRQALTTLRDAELSLLTPGQRHLRNLAEITIAAERAGTSQARLAAILNGLNAQYAASTGNRIQQLDKEVMTLHEVHSARIKELDDLRAAGLSSQTYWRQVGRMNLELAKQAGIIGGGKGVASGGIGQSLTSALGMLGLKYYAVSQAMSIASAGIRTALDFDRQVVAFASITGSIDESNAMMQKFLDLSARAPLSITAMQGMARTMLSFGSSARDATQGVEMIAKITGGDEMRSQNMALAFAQIRGQGKLMGQELRQMIDAGFNPLEQISKATGKSMGELREIMEKGGISFGMVRQAMTEVTSGGGRFANLLNDISGTMSGKMQAATADLNKTFIELTDGMQYDFANAVDLVSGTIKAVVIPVFYTLKNWLVGIPALIYEVGDAVADSIPGVIKWAQEWGSYFYSFIKPHIDYINELKHAQSLLNAPTKSPEETAAEKAKNEYDALNTAIEDSGEAFKGASDEITSRFQEALRASGKYTEMQLKIAEIESSGIKMTKVHKEALLQQEKTVQAFVDKVQQAQKELESIAEKQKGMQDMYKKLLPETVIEDRVDQAIEQIKMLENQFGLENLGIDMADITRVMQEATGSKQKQEEISTRLGDAVQAGSSEAIRKLYDVQVKQDPTVALENINATQRQQLELWQQKLGGTLVLSPATP